MIKIKTRVGMEGRKMKEKLHIVWSKEWVQFVARTLFYFLILMGLIYLYHYRTIQGGTFIYNEF
ncbi:hypothetical protein HMPREF9088_0140 [Enterococcus italicus DSM 15952]|uniref:D-Ala-teichoic acid biosynthesis protein n=1 Tax=Enterococcus italicus (strain DSM 15952 / CCUG 50447 / LMG 22039 / TP 1.5) TaxID=888064 RepID=E6LCQ0_ENTI1|nr:hypothetical protein HMPREF9088_0140 [Enterococcus italicus DSM 15952]